MNTKLVDTMKLPEKPFNIGDFLSKDFEGFSKALADENLRKLASEFNKSYFYWSELKYRVEDESKRKYLWVIMKFLRSNSYEKLKFKDIKMKYNLLSEFSKKLHQFDKNLAGNIKIDGKILNLQESYIISSLMEEAIASSQLEGASTTRKVAKAMLRERRKPKTLSEKMIFNNYQAMQFILKNKDQKISQSFLLELQRIVTKETLEDPRDEGIFRDNDEITIRNDDVIAHIPPKYTEISSLIEEFCSFANSESEDFIHPILKGAILHFLIGYIHPFNDGNGRTARSIFYWYMLSQGYWLFEYMTLSRRILRSRKNYDLAYLYTEYDEMDLTYFIKYLLSCVENSLADMLEYIRHQEKEQQRTKEIIKNNPDLSLRQALILEGFMQNPTKLFTIKEISETYAVVYQTARTDLFLLEKKGFITKKLAGKTFVFLHK